MKNNGKISPEMAARAAYGDDFVRFLTESDVARECGVRVGKSRLGNQIEVECPGGHHDAGKKAYATPQSLARCNACGRHAGGWANTIVEFSFAGVSKEEVWQTFLRDPRIRAEYERSGGGALAKPAPMAAFVAACRAATKGSIGERYLVERRGIDTQTQGEDRWFFVPQSPPRLSGYSIRELVEADVLRRRDEDPKAPPEKWVLSNPWRGRVCEQLPDGTLYGRAVRPDAFRPHMYGRHRKSGEPVFVDRVKEATQKGTLEKVLVVESLLDAASCSQLARLSGLKGRWITVSTMGTKGVKPEVLAEKLAPAREVGAEIVFVPDNDPIVKDGILHRPGQIAALEKAYSLEATGFQVRVARFRKEGDPNDMTAKWGFTPDDFRRLVAEAVLPFEYDLWLKRLEKGRTLTEDARRGYWVDVVRLVREHWNASIPESDILAFIARMGGWTPAAVADALSGVLAELSEARQLETAKRFVAQQIKTGKSKREITVALGLVS